jgi:enoyl-CoA hydratase/carnithine racemase
VGTITLDRPQRLNSLTFESYIELGAFFPALERHPEVRALVITRRGQGVLLRAATGRTSSRSSSQRDMPGCWSSPASPGRSSAAIRRVRGR